MYKTKEYKNAYKSFTHKTSNQESTSETYAKSVV
jgi:hypothetical protein